MQRQRHFTALTVKYYVAADVMASSRRIAPARRGMMMLTTFEHELVMCSCKRTTTTANFLVKKLAIVLAESSVLHGP